MTISIATPPLIDALDAALSGGEAEQRDALTTEQIAAALSLPVNKVHALLKAQIAAGKIEPCRVPRTDISGRVQSVPAYRLTGD